MGMGPYAGDLFVCRQKSDGTYPEGSLKLEVKKLEPDVSDADVKHRLSRSRANYMQATKTIITPKPTKIKVDLDEDHYEAGAMVFLGEREPFTVEAATVTNREITVAKGLWTGLGAENITEETVVIKSADGNTTYDEGSDYEIDYEGGLILATEDGNLPSGPAKASFDHGAVTGTEIQARKSTTIRARLLLLGHEVNDSSKRVRWWATSAVLNPAGGYDLAASEPIVQAFAGTLESINGAAPFVVRYC